jgi:hypothetical protein
LKHIDQRCPVGVVTIIGMFKNEPQSLLWGKLFGFQLGVTIVSL